MFVVLEWITFLCLVLRVAGVPGTDCTVDNDGIGRLGPQCEFMCWCKDRGECDQTSGTCKAGCVRGMFGPRCQYHDIAHDQKKYARHSDNLKQHRYAELAVDNDPNTCSSTAFENITRTEPPWWRIWFPYDVSFNYIEMTTKQTTLRYMSNFSVSVTNIPSYQSVNKTYWPLEEHFCYQYQGDGFILEKEREYAIFKFFCRPLSLGNTIKITLGSTETQLELCDVNIKQGRSIAHSKQTSSSPANKGNANNAVDGSHDNKKKSRCFRSIQSDPWWQVDLGRISIIRELRLTPFHEDIEKSFSGYEVNISIEENNSTWKTVFKDDESGQMYVNLTVAVRHIRIYRQDKTRLILCEVDVFEVCGYRRWGGSCEKDCYCGDDAPCDMYTGVCPGTSCDNNMYGQHCSSPCSEHCSGGCNKGNGACSPCKLGYEGHFCNESCQDNKFGQNCSELCGDYCHGICNKINGTCPCLSGYTRPFCRDRCDDGRFGQDCSQTCSKQCSGTCHHANGFCSKCLPGYQGKFCNTTCDDKTYGQNCSNKCSDHCFGPCDKISGTCTECESGFEGPFCNKSCTKTKWGMNCNKSCGQCATEECNPYNGFCITGCKAGYKPNTCHEHCDSGSFGVNCRNTCNPNCQGPCNKINGHCLDCKSGWNGSYCDKECELGTWGKNCSQTCGGCHSENCSKTTGQCLSGCKPGYKISLDCLEECEAGSHGVDCQERCGMCAGDKACHPGNGTCPLGCNTGFSGEGCTQKLQASSEPHTVALGVGGGVLALTIIAAVVVVLVMRRRKATKSQKNLPANIIQKSAEIQHLGTSKAPKESTDGVEESMKKQDKSLPVAPTEDPSVVQEPTYGKMMDEEGPRKPVTLSHLLSYIITKSADQTYFRNEYAAIPTGMIHPATAARDPANAGKSRYKNLYAYDHSRVHLKKQQGGTDYINACYIQGYSGRPEFIASQGPMDAMIEDFIRMIWEKDVITVVMVTNLVELGKIKCLQYWGEVNVEKEIGMFVVVLTAEQEKSDFVVRDLKVFKKTNRDVARSVRQFHYTAWPDKDVPDSPASLLMFWYTVRAYDPRRAGPWLVHCSAGVGRTGTFIAMDILHSQGNQTGVIDVVQCVNTLRDQRVNMVQTLSQYKFLHEVMYEALVLSSWPVPVDEFPKEHQRLLQVDPVLNKTNILLEYENEKAYQTMVLSKVRLDSDGQEIDAFRFAKLPENVGKNRSQSVLAQNMYRPFLRTPVSGRNDYINAVYIPTLSDRYAFVVSQTPLEDTLVDFCRLIHDHDIRIVVSFPDEGREQVGRLPTSGSSTIGPFTVRLEKEKTSDSIIHRKYSLTNKTGGKKEFCQLVYKKWTRQQVVPSDQKTFVQLLQEVETRRKANRNSPVLITCLTGYERSGLVAVLLTILDILTSTGAVSVPLVIRHLRTRRQQLIPTFGQFQFCHDVALDHANTSNTYANV
ncbi:uncharacterized protein LOC128229311 isoform X3 [Mya arenaria]|uniref:uncharacterized protein LOC128229311 isoform X3 n=1 Tax=Mya arenaria TaxID=6604 RepID=UPI0022E00BCB|nr:uncharacterized protein LOC128229311 isoform X3 [Mya arenaria]